MRGRCLIAAVLVLLCVGVWAQEADADAKATDPIIVVVSHRPAGAESYKRSPP